ncbi:MAG TPA: hypothetical protein VF020_01215 [Chthoniobacterales bacterium]
MKVARQFTAWDAKKRRMLVLLGCGSIAGLLLGVAASQILSAIVYQASAQDPFVLGAASYFKSPSTERTGEAAALGALSHGSIRPDHTTSLATTAKFAGFSAEDHETLALIETCFVTNDAFAFLAIVSAADRGGNRPGVFVHIVHYIEPSGRQPLGVHKGTVGIVLPGEPGINPIYWARLRRWPQ